MFARTFIDRPVMAWVISIVIVLFGLAAQSQLPIEQYPQIAPPTIQVSASYPGASAELVAASVSTTIEEQVNGVENMLYMSSQATNDGGYALTVTFKLGTDLNIAQVLIQNRIQLAVPRLPQEVQRQGLSVRKRTPDVLMVVNIFSPDESRDAFYLSNYTTTQIIDEITRTEGVGDVFAFGRQDYTMRAWLNPDQLAANNLTAPDVVAAIRNQNVQVAAGQVGAEPAPPGTEFTYTLNALGRLNTEEEFRQIVVKVGAPTTDATGAKVRPAVRLKDVARVELTSRTENITAASNGTPIIGMAVFQLPGSNALDTSSNVVAKMEELKRRFPSGVDYLIRYDTTPFIRQSVTEVFHTLRDAIILVAIVVLLFLQDWRAVILPMIDVPVSLLGTLAVMYVAGFTLNNLTLFGLVLAIGIVVDDAIVVLENVERWIAKGYDSRAATIHAMSEITGPIIGITLVLSCVFIPSSLLPGLTGRFYKQFALTIATAMMISAINAMTLTPSRAAAIFKNRGGPDGHATTETLPWYGWAALLGYASHVFLEPWLAPKLGLHSDNDVVAILIELLYALPGVILGALIARPANAILRRFYKAFNWAFHKFSVGYRYFIRGLLYVTPVVLLAYCGLVAATYFGFRNSPTGFIPQQDKGYLITTITLPDAASVQRTREVVGRMDAMARKVPGVKGTVGIIGQSLILGASGSNFATMFITLDDFENRKNDPSQNAFVLVGKLQGLFTSQVQEAQVQLFPPPPVSGLGNSGGFKVMIEDRGGMGPVALQKQTDAIIAATKGDPSIAFSFSLFRADTPQLFVDVDRQQAMQMGIPIDSIFSTLQIYLGSAYVNDFNRDNRTWQVTAQADAKFRVTKEYIRNLKVRTDTGEMVPLGSVLTVRDDKGPIVLPRYNMYPAAALLGAFPPGVSTGTGIKAVEAVATETLPKQFATEWTEISYLQTQEGPQAFYAFGGAVVLVYLVLGALYNSWSLPLAVILVVPMCILSALVGIWWSRGDVNIFAQIGFIVLVGLACKNAILVVEFAQDARLHGMSLLDATLEACQVRLRPIIMTSLAFTLGTVPLILSVGAGSEMRKALGWTVVSGMIGVTLFGLILTPVFYYVIERIKGEKHAPRPPEPQPDLKKPGSPPAAPPATPQVALPPHEPATAGS
jgi:multidrug efflux pump